MQLTVGPTGWISTLNQHTETGEEKQLTATAYNRTIRKKRANSSMPEPGTARPGTARSLPHGSLQTQLCATASVEQAVRLQTLGSINHDHIRPMESSTIKITLHPDLSLGACSSTLS